MVTCEHCKLVGPHDDYDTEGCLKASQHAMKTLLGLIGDKGVCAGCKAEIYWVVHRNGKRTPYTPVGLNHFIDCPEAARFGHKK